MFKGRSLVPKLCKHEVDELWREQGTDEWKEMDMLPEEVLAAVLERLALRDLVAAARVSRRWARAARRRLTVVRRRGHEARASRGTSRLLVTAPRADLALALALAPRLTSLTVHARRPLAAAELELLERLPRLRHLDVFQSGRVLTASAVPVAAELRALVINDAVAPGVLRALCTTGAERLEELHMFGRAQYYPARELTALLTLRRDRLTELTLRCGELRDAAYEAIGRCSALVALRLYSCWLLTGGGARHVSRPRGLRVLHVTGARLLWPSALHELLGALPPRLEELALSAGRLRAEHAATLAASPPAAGLRVLEAWRCGLGAAGALALAGALPSLRDLDVDSELSAADVRELAAHPALVRLRCAGAAGGAAGGAGRLRVRAAGARVGRGALRPGGGEGPRADMFYSWAGELAPLRSPPAFDDDRDDDYSLLGTDHEDD